MQTLPTNSFVKATSDQVSSELGPEVVILHVKDGMYYGLNEVGMMMWRELQDGCSVGDLIERVSNQYQVDRQQCEEDVKRVLQEMMEAHLVTVETK
jgi:hypothetical protein